MNLTAFNAVNGIATTARSNLDMSTMSICEEIAQKLGVLSSIYDASASSSSPVYIQVNPYPPTPVAGSYDSQANVGLTNIKQVGG